MSEPATLLVADDDPGLRESLERTLTREGYRVLLASDGRAALERLQGGAVDLIVTDLKMPGLTGLELLRAAKAIAPDVDVILLTAFGTVEEAVKAMKDGAYDFLTKPFRREQLLKLIDKALERRELIERNKVLQQRLDDLLRQGAIVGAPRAHPGRERHGQGAGAPRHPRALDARRQAVRRRQLRGAAGDAAGVR